MRPSPFSTVTADAILAPFARFGVNLGLERIETLLTRLDDPHRRVRLIHVAGSNGKGSVCAYLSSILAAAGYRVGRYTSPHLVDWTERICINDRSIDGAELERLLVQVTDAIQPGDPTPTQFEVITAAAWLYFARQQVDVAVMEVGLGGRLDATNVCDRPLVSIITSISWEHWQRLGPTLGDIAGEKAGILKSGCPAIVGSLPPEAKAVVDRRIAESDCPATWVEPATVVSKSPPRASYGGIEYPLSLLGDAQLMNSAIAMATVESLRGAGWSISDAAVQTGMAEAKWLGRLQWTQWRDRRIMADGAHNAAAAWVLRRYVERLNTPVTWVMGMLSTKDRAGVFKALLRSGDCLYLVPVPDHSSADPVELAELARTLCPDLVECRCYPELKPALDRAVEIENSLPILCGSLYLVGHFLSWETSLANS